MPRGIVSQFLTQREIARQKDMSRDLQDTAENIELYRTGLEELPLGELMAFDGRHTLFNNKELWKRKIENASQDRGLLSLNAPSITDECFSYFLAALREVPQVKMLCIDTNLTDSQLTMLAREIDAKDPFPLKLESISFNMDNRPQPEVMEQLFTAIGTNPSIQQLTFRDYVFSDKDAKQLNTNLDGHRGLATISIKHSVFYENGMRSLIDLLRKNSNLTALRLSFCSAEELTALFSSLNETSLTYLYLSDSFLTVEAVKILTEAIRTNTKLEYLYLNNRSWSSSALISAFSRLQEAIEASKTMQQAFIPESRGADRHNMVRFLERLKLDSDNENRQI